MPLQVLDLVPANANDSMVDCTIPNAGRNWGVCTSMLMLLQDDTKTNFVKSTLVNVVRAGKSPTLASSTAPRTMSPHPLDK